MSDILKQIKKGKNICRHDNISESVRGYLYRLIFIQSIVLYAIFLFNFIYLFALGNRNSSVAIALSIASIAFALTGLIFSFTKLMLYLYKSIKISVKNRLLIERLESLIDSYDAKGKDSNEKKSDFSVYKKFFLSKKFIANLFRYMVSVFRNTVSLVIILITQLVVFTTGRQISSTIANATMVLFAIEVFLFALYLLDIILFFYNRISAYVGMNKEKRLRLRGFVFTLVSLKLFSLLSKLLSFSVILIFFLQAMGVISNTINNTPIEILKLVILTSITLVSIVFEFIFVRKLKRVRLEEFKGKSALYDLLYDICSNLFISDEDKKEGITFDEAKFKEDIVKLISWFEENLLLSMDLYDNLVLYLTVISKELKQNNNLGAKYLKSIDSMIECCEKRGSTVLYIDHNGQDVKGFKPYWQSKIKDLKYDFGVEF